MLLLLLACGGADERLVAVDEPGTVWVTASQTHMATQIDVVLPSQSASAAQKVFAIFAEVDARASEWKETSPLSEVNRSAGNKPVVVPDDLRALIRRGRDIGEATDGAFEITWGALWGLWDFRADEPVLPTDAAIAQRLDRIDYRKVHIDEDAGTVFLEQEGMLVGLGGIAKGYALDRSASELRDAGVREFSLSAGGQVMVGGLKDGRKWRVGIRDPRGAPTDFFALVEVTDVSVSTSGDYERYFEVDGVRYHHILDPRTGRPSRGLRSATIVSADATLADALSTAVMVLGAPRGLALLATLDSVEGVLVDAKGGVHVTPGIDLVEVHAPR